MPHPGDRAILGDEPHRQRDRNSAATWSGFLFRHRIIVSLHMLSAGRPVVTRVSQTLQ